MSSRNVISSWLLMLLVAWIPAARASTPTANTSAPAASSHKAVYSCAEGYERLLPGEYYACRARYHFERKHYSQLMETLKEAAHWASKDAQYTLGLIYLNGDVPGVPSNRPQAIAWLALAAERKDATYAHMYSLVCLHSTPVEIRAGAVMFQKMSLEYGDKVAGTLAVRRFNREMKPIEDAANRGGLMWLSGFSPFPENGVTMLVRLHGMADNFFEGLRGTVTVGELPQKYAHIPPAKPAD